MKVAGLSIPVVHTIRVRVDRVRFPEARYHVFIKRTPSHINVF